MRTMHLEDAMGNGTEYICNFFYFKLIIEIGTWFILTAISVQLLVYSPDSAAIKDPVFFRYLRI